MPGDNVNHFTSVRMRATGTGNLLTRLLSLSETRAQVLTPLVLSATNPIAPTILSNFTQQRAALEIKTTEINETFRISKITIYAKPVATGYPQ